MLIEALKPLAHLPLFYPCSGSDWIAPVETFAPYIKEFWFVDIGYFQNEAYENVVPVLNASDSYKFLDVAFRLARIDESVWQQDEKYQRCPPVVRTETYQHTATGEVITVHRHRRTKPSALRTEMDSIGIFYYHGDSDEDGSGTHWLTIRKWNEQTRQQRIMRDGCLIFEVLDKLANGGLLVTEGSMCEDENNPYKELRRFRSNHSIGKQAVEQAQAFTDPKGREFR